METAKEIASKAAQKLICPLESEEQQALFQWAKYAEGKYPELKLLYHIPNGGLRNKAVAVRLTAEGVRRGVPDMCLPVARGKYHGLYVELKRRVGGVVSKEQKQWCGALIKQGYCAVTCYGCEDAIKVIEAYLQLTEVT